ncbi:MAG: MXAN_5187 C-terminal domain-containing protein [Deltaproteobacteria bacterium]|nr:MXAN_5187 C-terminal domain-containing protein [Deltaproteobacteria bacterium]
MGAKEDIEFLESKIARLKVEYEQYFMRVLKREPAKLRDETEKLILLYSNKNVTNTSIKFKYNSIVARYNSYKQYWTRTLRAIEEGEFVRKSEGDEQALRPPETDRKPAPGADEGRPKVNDKNITGVYERYIEARKMCNEPTDGITMETLERTVEEYKKKVEEKYNTKDIELKVYIKDGKAKLAITPKK